MGKKTLFFFAILLTAASLSSQAIRRPAALPVDRTKFAYVPASVFFMGSDTFAPKNEQPRHTVTVNGYYISLKEVTFQEFDSFTVATSRDTITSFGWARGSLPAVGVSWYDAVNYCNWLSDRDSLSRYYNVINDTIVYLVDSGRGYRLPTEAEWEFAARGGSQGNGTDYSGSREINEVAWHQGNSDAQPHNVATREKNELRVYDMSGNAAEWVWDIYQEDYYSVSPGYNPKGSQRGTKRVVRGGAWSDDSSLLKVSVRQYYAPSEKLKTVGFRIARTFY